MKFSDVFRHSLTPRRILLYVVRAALAYLSFLVLYQLTTGLVRRFHSDNFVIDDRWSVYLITLLILPFVFYSVMRLFLIGDTFGRQVAAKADAGETPVRFGDAFFSPVSAIFVLVALVLYGVLPMSFGYRHLVAIFDLASFFDPLTEKLLLLWLILPMMLLLIPLAHRSACRLWRKKRQSGVYAVDRLTFGSVFGFFKNETTWGGLVLRLILLFLLYPIGSFLAVILTHAVLMPFLMALVERPRETLTIVGLILLILSGLVFLVFLISIPAALHKRRRLIKRLKRVCAEKGYELSSVRAPYRGLFRFYEGADFRVRIGERTYDCKLIGSKLKSGVMVFDYEGLFEVRFYLRFPRASRVTMGGAYMHTSSVELFKTVTDYTFESDNKKLLIICPTCAMTAVIDRGGFCPIDTGSAIGEYKIFNSTGFLGALERDCLDR